MLWHYATPLGLTSVLLTAITPIAQHHPPPDPRTGSPKCISPTSIHSEFRAVFYLFSCFPLLLAFVVGGLGFECSSPAGGMLFGKQNKIKHYSKFSTGWPPPSTRPGAVLGSPNLLYTVLSIYYYPRYSYLRHIYIFYVGVELWMPYHNEWMKAFTWT